MIQLLLESFYFPLLVGIILIILDKYLDSFSYNLKRH